MIHRRKRGTNSCTDDIYKTDKSVLDLVLDKRYDALFADECEMVYPWGAKKRTKWMVIREEQRNYFKKIQHRFGKINVKIRELRPFSFLQAYALPDGRELRNVLACMVNIRPV